MGSDDVAALLAGWREAARASTEPDDVAFLILAADAMPRLVGAIEAVLKIADQQEAIVEPTPVVHRQLIARALRSAIFSELTKKGGTNDT